MRKKSLVEIGVAMDRNWEKVSVCIIFIFSCFAFPYRSYGAEVGLIKVCRSPGIIAPGDRKNVVYRKGWTFTSYMPEKDKRFAKIEEKERVMSLQGKSVQKLYEELNRYQEKLFSDSFDVRLINDAVLGPKPKCAIARVEVIRGKWKDKTILYPQSATPDADFTGTSLRLAK
ncbi:hypothetical protein [Leptospirillum ferriphilum]|uniref:hypothetical protein n=1 Tax=Leptospirillum ferriphilum TaxID=178606 RepID=UPI0005A1E280|nr:hypothetical protein [Leptospirillum ferriphilum]